MVVLLFGCPRSPCFQCHRLLLRSSCREAKGESIADASLNSDNRVTLTTQCLVAASRAPVAAPRPPTGTHPRERKPRVVAPPTVHVVPVALVVPHAAQKTFSLESMEVSVNVTGAAVECLVQQEYKNGSKVRECVQMRSNRNHSLFPSKVRSAHKREAHSLFPERRLRSRSSFSVVCIVSDDEILHLMMMP